MFREQYDRAQKAMSDRNWRQAVHYLSIAAAIHPDNEQVREQLKQARAEKRKQEAGV
jgi:outer membrane protein assembly factor BamD (BamD/ComL family)